MVAALQRVQAHNRWPLERIFVWCECVNTGTGTEPDSPLAP